MSSSPPSDTLPDQGGCCLLGASTFAPWVACHHLVITVRRCGHVRARASYVAPSRHMGDSPSARRRRAFWATSTPARGGHFHHDLAAVGLTLGSSRGSAESPCSRMSPDEIRPDCGTVAAARPLFTYRILWTRNSWRRPARYPAVPGGQNPLILLFSRCFRAPTERLRDARGRRLSGGWRRLRGIRSRW